MDVVSADKLVIEKEPDKIWENEEEYKEACGDYKKNGHQKGWSYSLFGIRVPGKQITSISNRKERGTEMRERMADGSMSVEQGQVEKMFNENGPENDCRSRNGSE